MRGAHSRCQGPPNEASQQPDIQASPAFSQEAGRTLDGEELASGLGGSLGRGQSKDEGLCSCWGVGGDLGNQERKPCTWGNIHIRNTMFRDCSPRGN